MTDYTKANGFAEDLGALIGVSATNRLMALYGGALMYVPETASLDHPIAMVIGIRKMEALCREFGSQTVRIPQMEDFNMFYRVRGVSILLCNGLNNAEIARVFGTTPRQIQRYRAQAEELGLMPYVLDGAKGVMFSPDQMDMFKAEQMTT